MGKKKITLAELAELVGGEVLGNPETVLANLADFDNAGPGEITFISKKQQVDKLISSRAAACIIPQDVTGVNIPSIRVNNPILSATIIHNFFVTEPFVPEGVHSSAHIGVGCQMATHVTVGPMVVLGDRVKIGMRVTIEPGVVVGSDVSIDDDTLISANVTIHHDCVIGKRVIIQSGTVIGSDGFGYVPDENGNHIKRSHVGNVEIEDDVEIGANVCIDRATFGTTVIRKGAKIDNLVQIAHNVDIGERSLIVGQAGIAGSVKLGKGNVLGGQVGIKDHVELGDGVIAAARSGIASNVESGSVVAGFPAYPHKQWLRATMAIPRIPDTIKEVRNLRKQLNALQEEIEKLKERDND